MASLTSNNTSLTSPTTVTISSTGTNNASGTILSGYAYNTASAYGNITINNGGSSYTTASSTYAGVQSTLSVTGNADIKGDLTVKGINVAETLEAINKRLAILVPDPDKLEKFEALKKAYDHYKLLEALCHEEKKDDQ